MPRSCAAVKLVHLATKSRNQAGFPEDICLDSKIANRRGDGGAGEEEVEKGAGAELVLEGPFRRSSAVE